MRDPAELPIPEFTSAAEQQEGQQPAFYASIKLLDEKFVALWNLTIDACVFVRKMTVSSSLLNILAIAEPYHHTVLLEAYRGTVSRTISKLYIFSITNVLVLIYFT